MASYDVNASPVLDIDVIEWIGLLNKQTPLNILLNDEIHNYEPNDNLFSLT